VQKLFRQPPSAPDVWRSLIHYFYTWLWLYWTYTAQISDALWKTLNFIPMFLSSSAAHRVFPGKRPFREILSIHCFREICSVCPHIGPLTFRQRPTLQWKVSLVPLSHTFGVWHSLKLEKQGLVLGACWG